MSKFINNQKLKQMKKNKLTKTLGQLIGGFHSKISEYLLVTDKGILVNGLSQMELESDFNSEINIDEEIISTKFYQLCVAFDDEGIIKAVSVTPGDYLNSYFDGKTFKVYGHDGVETINISKQESNYKDRAYFLD